MMAQMAFLGIGLMGQVCPDIQIQAIVRLAKLMSLSEGYDKEHSRQGRA